MTAKQRFMEQAAERQRKHPKTAPKIVSFSLAMVFFGLSLIFIGVAHAPQGGESYTMSWIESIMMIACIITLQGAVVCSALGVTSTRYVLHCISCTTLTLSLLLDIGLAVYYFVWVL